MQTDAPPPAPPAAAPVGPPPIPPAVRWLLIVFLPAIGFTSGAFLMFSLLRLDVAALAIVCFLGGCLGAALLLVIGLVMVPWVPGADAPSAAIGLVPPAPHPDGLSWLGPTAAVLVGLGAGIPIGAGIGAERRYSYSDVIEPFTRASFAIILFASLATMLFLVHQRHGPVATPLERPPLHRLVFRCLLRAAVGGLLAGLAGWAALLGAGSRDPSLEDFLVCALGGSVLAGFFTVGEAVAWRARLAWRWPALLACGALVPLVIPAMALFFDQLFRSGNALGALDDMLGELARTFKGERPSQLLGLGVSIAAPFALMVAARTGLLPYFGRRAPWPLIAQVPLSWLLAALALALSHLLVDSVGARNLREGVPVVLAALAMLLVGMRLSDPLEGRIASRWVLLTGGRD